MGFGETERPLGEVFDSVAEDYDMFRRGYPATLVDAAIKRGSLVNGSRVLEVGCGTGKLTELLAARQLIVDAVDPGPRMIEQAKRRVGGRSDVRFHVGRFEDVALPEKAFDAVFSATAFHWVDPLIGWAKTASHLRSGGLLALLSHLIVQDERSAVADKGFRELLREHAPTVAQAHPPTRDLDAILEGQAPPAASRPRPEKNFQGGGVGRPQHLPITRARVCARRNSDSRRERGPSSRGARAAEPGGGE